MKPTISLTFDDGMLCQQLFAVPELDKRNIRATFFLILNSEEFNLGNFVPSWKQIASQGHEIGNHSANHRKAAEVIKSAFMCNEETIVAKYALEEKLGVEISSYCYPYTDAPSLLQDAVKLDHKQARGGRVARQDKFLVPGCGANLFNVPAIHVGPETIRDFPKWIAETITRRAWLTLMFHGVGQPTAWDNIGVDQFVGLLDGLTLAREKHGLEILPFSEAADAYRRG